MTIPFTFQDLNSGLFKANFQLNDEQSLRFGGVFYDNDFFANSYFQNVNSERSPPSMPTSPSTTTSSISG